MTAITLKRPPSALLFFALFSLLFTTIFNYTVSLMASPYIVSELGGSNDIATYTVSFFALGNALGVPLGRVLIPRLGPARFLFLVLILFTFFSWTCAAAPNYPFFNASRFLQGFVSGPFYALAFYLLSALQPPERRNFFSAITLTLFTICPVLGASWGGWIAYEWNWRWIFYLNLPFLLLLSFYFKYRLKEIDTIPMEKPPFDAVGYCAFFIAIFCLSFIAITGQELDWQRSSLLLALAAIGIPLFLFFIFWEINHPHPIIALKLLKKLVLSFALLNLAILFSAYFGMVLLLSLWLKLWVNYTPDWIAALLAIMALTAIFPPLLIGKRADRIDNRVLLSLAIVFLAISCFHTMFFNVDINFGRIAVSRLLAGIGLALFLAPIFKLCFHGIPKEDVLHVLGLFQVVRALSSGLGASLYDILWQRRQIFFHERLGSKLTALSPETQEFFAKAKLIDLKGEHATAQLEYYLQREATSLALDDCFYLMAWILIGLLLTFLFTFFSQKGSFLTD